MPINIPSGLYTGGRATFDTSPMTNAILKDLASQKAAKEAIKKNANNLAFKLNSAGIRTDVDLPEWNRRATEWYNNAVAGNIDYGQYQKLINEAEQSRNRGKFVAESGKLANDEKIEMDENDVAVINNANKSIYDPTSYKEGGGEYGVGDLSPNIKTLNPIQRNALANSLLSGVPKEIDETKLTKTAEGYIQYTSEIKNDKIKNVADRALPLFSTREMLKTGKQLRLDPEFMSVARPAFKEIYGQDAEIDSPQKALQAEIILAAKTKGETITKRDTDVDFKIWKKKFDLAERGRNIRASIKAATAGVGEPVVERYKTLSAQMDAFGSGYFPLTNANAETAGMIVGFSGAKVDRKNLYTKKDADGTIRAYKKKSDGTYEDRGVIDQTSLDVKQPGGVKPTKVVVGRGEVGKTPPPAAPKQKKISDYPSNIQNAIKAYMGASKLNEADAIDKLIKAGKLK